MWSMDTVDDQCSVARTRLGHCADSEDTDTLQYGCIGSSVMLLVTEGRERRGRIKGLFIGSKDNGGLLLVCHAMLQLAISPVMEVLGKLRLES
jgi:hypothetical protein